MTTECLFCYSYQKNKDRNSIIFENEGAYSIFNYKPAVPGHTLVITKEHIFDLEALRGSFLEDFIHAIPLTFGRIVEIYEKNPERIYDFYKSIITSPPEPDSRKFALEMLSHPHINEKPNSYNWGMNIGYEAGQREVHIHIHLFPRRGSGLGIATAMRNHIRPKNPKVNFVG